MKKSRKTIIQSAITFGLFLAFAAVSSSALAQTEETVVLPTGLISLAPEVPAQWGCTADITISVAPTKPNGAPWDGKLLPASSQPPDIAFCVRSLRNAGEGFCSPGIEANRPLCQDSNECTLKGVALPSEGYNIDIYDIDATANGADVIASGSCERGDECTIGSATITTTASFAQYDSYLAQRHVVVMRGDMSPGVSGYDGASYGSGVLVGEHWVLTNRHNVEPPEMQAGGKLIYNVTVGQVLGKPVIVKALWRPEAIKDKDLDLAFLEVVEADRVKLPAINPYPTETDMSYFDRTSLQTHGAMRYVQFGTLSKERGSQSMRTACGRISKAGAINYEGGRYIEYMTDSGSTGGNSGGAVISARGHLIGLVTQAVAPYSVNPKTGKAHTEYACAYPGGQCGILVTPLPELAKLLSFR